MRWWHVLFPAVVETPQGLYRPSNRFLDYCLPTILGLVIVGMFLQASMAGKTNYFILGYLGIIIVTIALAWRARRRFGPMGQPLVRVDASEVYLKLPHNVGRGHVQVPLASLQKLVIKGTPGQRSYVFERHVGEPIEVRPGFMRDDVRVADFLQRAMPANIPLVVHEPPTFLGSIRGD